MKTYSIWNNDLGDRSIFINDENGGGWHYSKNEYDSYVRACKFLENEGYVLSIPKPFVHVHTEGSGLVNALTKVAK